MFLTLSWNIFRILKITQFPICRDAFPLPSSEVNIFILTTLPSSTHSLLLYRIASILYISCVVVQPSASATVFSPSLRVILLLLA